MTYDEIKDAYDIVLAPAADRVLSCMPAPHRAVLADALRNELAEGPNSGKEIRFGSSLWADADGGDVNEIYTATPVSCDGYTVIHRPLTGVELNRLAELRGRPAASRGFYVIDILPAEAGFRRWPRLA
jgi:hypothetical protein